MVDTIMYVVIAQEDGQVLAQFIEPWAAEEFFRHHPNRERISVISYRMFDSRNVHVGHPDFRW